MSRKNLLIIYLLLLHIYLIYILITPKIKYEIHKDSKSDFAITKIIKKHIFSPTEILFVRGEYTKNDDPEYYLKWEMTGRQSTYGFVFAERNDSMAIIADAIIHSHNLDSTTTLLEPENGIFEDIVNSYPSTITLVGSDW